MHGRKCFERQTDREGTRSAQRRCSVETSEDRRRNCVLMRREVEEGGKRQGEAFRRQVCAKQRKRKDEGLFLAVEATARAQGQGLSRLVGSGAKRR